jgi:hypothetical protein
MVEIQEDEVGIFYNYLEAALDEDGCLIFEAISVQIADLGSELFFKPQE